MTNTTIEKVTHLLRCVLQSLELHRTSTGIAIHRLETTEMRLFTIERRAPKQNADHFRRAYGFDFETYDAICEGRSLYPVTAMTERIDRDALPGWIELTRTAQHGDSQLLAEAMRKVVEEGGSPLPLFLWWGELEKVTSFATLINGALPGWRLLKR